MPSQNDTEEEDAQPANAKDINHWRKVKAYVASLNQQAEETP